MATQFALQNPISFLATPPKSDHEHYACDKQILFNNDTIDIVISSNYINAASAYIYIIDAYTLDNIKEEVITERWVVEEDELYYGLFRINLGGLQDRCVFFRIQNDSDNYYSKICEIKESLDITCGENIITLSATNSHNQDGIYQFPRNSVQSSITLLAGIQKIPKVSANVDLYGMAYNRNFPLNTETVLTYEFNFGGKQGLPPHVANAIFAMLCCEEVYIDNRRYYLSEVPELQESEINQGRVSVIAKTVKESATSNFDNGNDIPPIADLPIIEVGKTYFFERPYFDSYFE
jgi:hypothetical protein